MGDLDRFRGLLGVAAILGAAWLFSENRRKISPRMVIGGLAMQCVLGFVLLRSTTGQQVLESAAKWVDTVLACSDAGARFVFGDKLADPAGPTGFVFAFRVLPTIVFVAALFAVLYHLGIMQVVVRAFAWVTAKILGSSGAETLNAAASIFLGQTEAPLVIRPYLPRLTRSELAVVMVSGMGLVSGGILGAYKAAGCDLRDLLTAILMSFPATIFLTKMFVPEMGDPETLGTLKVSNERIDSNVLDAAARGTREGMMLAANVGAVLISFIALVALTNLALGWVAVFYTPQLYKEGGLWVLIPILIGGLLYSVGAIFYALKKPGTNAKYFGFHELFHIFVLAAWISQYLAISFAIYRA
jgi:CNT family concentrative nucleoside transporter